MRRIFVRTPGMGRLGRRFGFNLMRMCRSSTSFSALARRLTAKRRDSGNFGPRTLSTCVLESNLEVRAQMFR